MWKWFRSWFDWRFSLRRLVVATVFLGAVVGLNMQEISLPWDYVAHRSDGNIETKGRATYSYHGWPLPFRGEDSDGLGKIAARPEVICVATFDPNEFDWLPWTHQGYRLLGHRAESGLFIDRAIFDALFALTVLFLILFLQIPRRKGPEQVK